MGETFLTSIPVDAIIGFLTVIASSVVAVFKSITFVREGELGVKLTFGRAVLDKHGKPKVIKPGFCLMIPFAQTLVRRHVRQQTVMLKKQKVTLADGLMYQFSATVVFQVKDVYKALFEIDNLTRSLYMTAMSALREVLMQKKHNELFDLVAISEELIASLKSLTDSWGVEILKFNVVDCAPSPESETYVTANAGVVLKVEALQVAARNLGFKHVMDIPPHLALCLAGIPVATTVSTMVPVLGTDKDNESAES